MGMPMPYINTELLLHLFWHTWNAMTAWNTTLHRSTTTILLKDIIFSISSISPRHHHEMHSFVSWWVLWSTAVLAKLDVIFRSSRRSPWGVLTDCGNECRCYRCPPAVRYNQSYWAQCTQFNDSSLLILHTLYLILLHAPLYMYNLTYES